tara:strand:+ start:105 stop:404 length:300 start_codon:yes stop_codon:yes gene_type:complete
MSKNYVFFLITPSLGLLRNYIKYKNLSLTLFIRSPAISIILFELMNLNYPQYNNLLISIILERWCMLFGKSLISFYNHDYLRKKQKYIEKYNLKYEKDN